MSEPISFPASQQPNSPMTPNVPQMSQQMYSQIQQLAELMQGLINDKSNSFNPSHLESFAQVITQIHSLVERSQTL